MDRLELQRRLNKAGHEAGPEDGIDGPQTAVVRLLREHEIPFTKWGITRRELAAKQQICKLDGIDVGTIDGLMGPQTREAFRIYRHRQLTGHDPEPWRDDAEKQPPVGPVPARSPWPKQSGVRAFYGEVGTNQTMVQLPYPMRIAWNKRQVISRFSCHEKVHDSIRRVLERVADAYTHEERQKHGLDLFGGCLNVRKMRGGSSWSMHSWGIAIDFDPERNRLRWGRDRAHLARPECKTFLDLWEEEGWLSLGRVRNYDWMHVQAAIL